MTDPYTILELQPPVTQKQIRQSYLRLAKKYHPDRPEGETHKFQRIQQAYLDLKDNQDQFKHAILDLFWEQFQDYLSQRPIFQFIFGETCYQLLQKLDQEESLPELDLLVLLLKSDNLEQLIDSLMSSR